MRFKLPPGVGCLAHLIVYCSPPAVPGAISTSLSLWVPFQCMPDDIACWFSERVPAPTPLAPTYLGVDSLLFSSFPQFFVPYDLWPAIAHDGPQASVDKGLQFSGGFFGCPPCF